MPAVIAPACPAHDIPFRSRHRSGCIFMNVSDGKLKYFWSTHRCYCVCHYLTVVNGEGQTTEPTGTLRVI